MRKGFRNAILGGLLVASSVGGFVAHAATQHEARIWAEVKCSHELTERTARNVTLTKWGDVDHVVYRCNADLKG